MGSQVELVDSDDSLRQAILDQDAVCIVGATTKAPLSCGESNRKLISVAHLTGVTEYEPSEFTFTARAGTRLEEIAKTLKEKNQYLPFDPMLVRSGATLGGTLAAGMSGPGRLRYGGLRDFILGIRFITGDGQFIHSGGRVVKNAAGFDIPKLLVGSCGTLAAMTDLTFKVFPLPAAWNTYQIPCADPRDAVHVMATAASGRWEPDAIDYSHQQQCVWIRFGADPETAQRIATDVQRALNGRDMERLADAQADDAWRRVGELELSDDVSHCVTKVPVRLTDLPKVIDQVSAIDPSAGIHASVAGSLLWISFDRGKLAAFDELLGREKISGTIVLEKHHSNDESKSRVTPAWIGHPIESELTSRIRSAFDPAGRFSPKGCQHAA